MHRSYSTYHPPPGRHRSESSTQPGASGVTASHQQPTAPLQPPYGHSRNASYDARLQQQQQQPHSQQSSTPLFRPTSLQPLITPAGSQQSSGDKDRGQARQSGYSSNPRSPTQVRYNLPGDRVYMPTTTVAPSNASTTASRRHYDKLADVYSTSGDTVAFARNLGDYIDERCPRTIWFCCLISLMLFGLLLMLFGSFNIPFCYIQPMIPIYLLVSGVLVMLSCAIRMFGLIPSGRSRPGLSSALCCNMIEGLFLIVNLVWLILGCVWVYGSKPYVVFARGLFDDHYCDEGLYWFSFAAISIQIALLILAILGLLVLLCVGAFKEAEPSLQDLDE